MRQGRKISSLRIAGQQSETLCNRRKKGTEGREKGMEMGERQEEQSWLCHLWGQGPGEEKNTLNYI